MNNGTLLQSIRFYSGGARALVFDSGALYLGRTAPLGLVEAIHAYNGSLINAYYIAAPVGSVAVSSNRIFVGGSDARGVLRQFGAPNASVMATFTGHTGAINALLVVGAQLWSGSLDGTVRQWQIAYGSDAPALPTNPRCVQLMRKNVLSCFLLRSSDGSPPLIPTRMRCGPPVFPHLRAAC